MADRIQLSEENLDEIVGGNFNWWKDASGTRKCLVNNIGTFVCTVEAKDTFAWLKAEHRGQGWTEQDYVNELVRLGEFIPV